MIRLFFRVMIGSSSKDVTDVYFGDWANVGTLFSRKFYLSSPPMCVAEKSHEI